MSILLTSVLLLVFSTAAFGSEKLKCHKGELRTREFGEVKILRSQFCTDKIGTILISEPFHKEVALGKIIPPSQSVNPGWVFCESLKGSPEMVDILIGKTWYELDRCLFKDGSYIDTGSLFELGVQE